MAPRGFRQIGSLTSGERGTLVTGAFTISCVLLGAFAVNAAGNSTPPFLVFPRVHYRKHYLRDGPIVTDRENPEIVSLSQTNIKRPIESQSARTYTSTDSTTNQGGVIQSSLEVIVDSLKPAPSGTPYPTPEQVRPFQKADPCKASNKGRKKRTSAILTDTPVKNALADDQTPTKDKKKNALLTKKKLLEKRLQRVLNVSFLNIKTVKFIKLCISKLCQVLLFSCNPL